MKNSPARTLPSGERAGFGSGDLAGELADPVAEAFGFVSVDEKDGNAEALAAGSLVMVATRAVRIVVRGVVQFEDALDAAGRIGNDKVEAPPAHELAVGFEGEEGGGSDLAVDAPVAAPGVVESVANQRFETQFIRGDEVGAPVDEMGP